MAGEIILGKGEEKTLHCLWGAGGDAPPLLHIRLVEEGARVMLRGVFLAGGHDDLKIHITVFHEAPRTRSNFVLRGIADDESTVAVHEVAKIARGAFGSETHVEAKAILRSDQAHAEIEPYLEIDEHEVRATHSAWVGPLEDEERFYLLSRGFSETAAEKLLLNAFFNPVREILPATMYATF